MAQDMSQSNFDDAFGEFTDLERVVCREVQNSENKAAAELNRYFDRRTVPPVSVLARLSRYDRDALIAHFRAKELRRIADFRREGFHYQAQLTVKRLQHVNGIAKAFNEITGSMSYL